MRSLVEGIESDVRRELEASTGVGMSELVKEATDCADLLEKIAKSGDDAVDRALLETFREGSSNKKRSEEVEQIRKYLNRAGVLMEGQS
ncbi:MAG: hypothetical protein WC455_09765 [Dehalococcoidia bacterium]|jgi:hypothetical protein